MKPIIYIILVILIVLLMGAIALSAVHNAAERDELHDQVRYTVTEIVDRRYTPPDDYELLYRTYLSNGLIVKKWERVSREEYEGSVNE